MSGVGKSTVAERLSELGYKAVETDYGDFSVVDEHGYCLLYTSDAADD